MIRAGGILVKQFRARLELQRNAGQALFERIVEFLGQARPLDQDGFRLDFCFLAGGDLEFKLFGSLDDAFFQQVVGALKFELRFFPFLNQEFQHRIFPRNHDRPTHNH